jgi:hypothetical protein
MHFRFDRAPRLAFADRNVVDANIAQRPAADKDLAVLPVRTDNGFGLDAVGAEGVAQHHERMRVLRRPATRIDLLKCDDVGLRAFDDPHHPLEIETPV